MDCLTFVSKLIEHLAWPLSLLGAALLLKDEIKKLLPLITKFEAGPLKVELAQIRKEADEAKAVIANVVEQIEPVVVKFAEPDPVPAPTEPTSAEPNAPLAPPFPEKPKVPVMSENLFRILDALCNSRYATRTLGGLSADTGFSTSLLFGYLKRLGDRGLAEKTVAADGSTRWYATASGKRMALSNSSPTQMESIRE